MAVEKEFLIEKKRFRNILDLLKYRKNFTINNPTYFYADGICLFEGPQGSGKTLSAVNYVYKLMEAYPNCKLVSNIMLTDYPIVTFTEWLFKTYGMKALDTYLKDGFTDAGVKLLQNEYLSLNRVFPFNNNDDFKYYSNLTEGVIFLVDEIQLYLNSLESKNINMETLVEISQQRKQRKHIVCTSQVFGRMAKPLREQFSSVVHCKNFLNCIQYNQLILQEDIDQSGDDMHIHGKVAKKIFYFHSPKMYKRYDTYYKIDRNKFISNEEKKGEIYSYERSINDGRN